MFRQTLSGPTWLLLADVSGSFSLPDTPSIPKSHHVQGIQGSGHCAILPKNKTARHCLQAKQKPSAFHSPFSSGQLEKLHKVSQILSLPGLNPPYSHGSWDQTQIPHPGIQLSLGQLLSSCLSTLYPHCPCFCCWNTQISFSLQDLCTCHSPCLELFPPIFTWLALHPRSQLGCPLPGRPSLTASLLICPPAPSWVPRPCVLFIPHGPWSSLKSFGLFIQVFPLHLPTSCMVSERRDSCGFAFLGFHLALKSRVLPGAP